MPGNAIVAGTRIVFWASACIIATELRGWMKLRSAAVMATVLIGMTLSAQEPLAKDPGAFLQPGQFEPVRLEPKTPAGPAPHLADGRPDFGGKGAWYPGFSGNIAEPKWKGVKSADKHVDVPFVPWSLKLFNERVENIGKD